MSEQLPNPDEPTPTFESDEELTARLADFDERLAAGEPPSEDLSDVSTSEEDTQVRRKLDCIRLLDRLRPGRSAEDPAEFPYSVGDSSWRHGDPTRIGRFQIRRKLGLGGFGAVYLAYDPKLRRQVALKVPHPRTILTGELRERFKLEAEMAAVLDHRNVVPVYESGEAGPLCYIASAYCPGISLAGWLKNQSDWIPANLAASLVAQIADGVQHAHERGVLHRDLKPGNVLLTPMKGGKPIDETPTVELTPSILSNISDFLPRITDFGMAKRVGEWESDGSLNEDPAAPLTKTGAVMGTPAYMAPEQAAGRNKDIGRATDVHALGVILYELLTKQPPFLAESSSEIIRRVQSDEPLPPRRLRPKLPRDLETICLKCLEKEPRRRYQTAAELAEDLRAFLDGKTIQARSVGPAERAWRWSNRQPLAAGLLMSLVLVIVGAIGGLSTLWMRERAQAELAREGQAAALAAQKELERQTAAAVHAREAADAARADEKKAREQAELTSAELRAGLEDFTKMARALSDEPTLRATKRSMLERLLGFHQRFLAVKGNDPAAIRDGASAFDVVASLQVELGRLDDAQNSYKRAMELCDKLAAFQPETNANRDFRAACYYRYGWFLIRRRGDRAEAFKYFDRGLNIIRDLHENAKDGHDYTQMYIVLLGNWAAAQVGLGRFKEARDAYETVRKLEEEVIRANPKAFYTRESHALSLMTYSDLTFLEGNKEETERLLREAVRVMREVIADGSPAHVHSYTLCRVLDRLAHFLHTRGKIVESELVYREALSISRRLVEKYPYVADYAEMFADVACDLGHDLARDRRADAHDIIVEALNVTRGRKGAGADAKRFEALHARALSLVVYRCDSEFSLEFKGYVEELMTYEPHRWFQQYQLIRLLLNAPDKSLRNYPEALRRTEGLLLAAGGFYQAQSLRGVAEYRNGNYAAAEKRFRPGIDYRDMPFYEEYIFMAMTLKKLGRESEASRYRDLAERVRRLAPDPTRTAEWDAYKAEADAVFAEPTASASR